MTGTANCDIVFKGRRDSRGAKSIVVIGIAEIQEFRDFCPLSSDL
jgi:hypothetical protein